MESITTFRQFNKSVYVRINPTFSEYFKLKKLIEKATKDDQEPECKIEEVAENQVLITFPKWG